jgi:hypothetical protein
MKRRTFLLALAGLFALVKQGVTFTRPEMTDEFIMGGLLEALVPDDDTPGAKETHLYEKLTHLISQDSKKKQRYRKGLSLVRKELEKNGKGKIYWDALLWQIVRSPFFGELRTDALQLFYSDPIGWSLVGYKGPPLIGYPDYYECR